MNQARAEARVLSLALSRARTPTPVELSRCGPGSGVFYCNRGADRRNYVLRDSASEPSFHAGGFRWTACFPTPKDADKSHEHP